MRIQSALAAAAGLVALAFALSTLERWLDRRKRHELAWTIALAMFTVGAGALWLGASDGWSGATFRVFYLFGAILNVPFLALGTIYLLGGVRRGDAWAAAIALSGAFDRRSSGHSPASWPAWRRARVPWSCSAAPCGARGGCAGGPAPAPAPAGWPRPTA